MPAIKKNDNSDSRIASLKLQNKEYNEMYRKWRIDHKDDYGFYFPGNSEELTYRDGEGFITEYPEAAERNAVNSIISVVGKTLIIYTLLRIATMLLFSDLPISLTHKVFYSSSGYFAGSETAAIVLSYTINIALKIIPQIYLLYKVRMPLKVMVPLKISNKPLFYQAMPMAMCVFGIITMFSGAEYFSATLFGFQKGNTIWIPENKTIMALAAILYTIILPVISEIVQRGIFMQTLRQFGDGYALIITGIISALTANSFKFIFFTFIYAVVIGYFSMRSGSIITAIVMRIVISTSSYWMTYIKTMAIPTDDYLTVSMVVTLVYLTVGIASLVVFMKKHSNKVNLPLYEMYISYKEKMMCFLASPSVLIWLSLTLLMAGMSNGICK